MPQPATTPADRKSSTAADKLAELGITSPQAREFVLSNLDHPGTIAGMAFSHGITLEMLAEIVGGDVTGLQIADHFAQRDIGVDELEELPEGDTLEVSTAELLDDLGATRDQVRDFIFAKLDELHLIVDAAREHGVSGEAISDIMGGGAVGQQIATMVRGQMEETETVLVGVPTGE